mmetsp:Transcript_8983/g.11320  ORF Transcript_8983/g.11320 Transcript_8983/m.11320 type:complete len:114 (-) Transcript_8983:103-444(-)
MDLEFCGLVLGLALCSVLFALYKDMNLDELFEMSGARDFIQSIIKKKSNEHTKVEASPELLDFLRSLQHERLLGPLTTWGARKPLDLKWLSEQDLKELGVADDTVFCDAIKCL